MRVVEIIIDLENPNGKPNFNFYDVTNETENYLHSKAKEFWDHGRRFWKKGLEEIRHPKKLIWTYAFKTDIEDYLEIEKSKEMKKAMWELNQVIKREMDYYQRHVKCIFDYYDRNY
ncbi:MULTISPECIES: hypothetical protein [Bacteria]|uniref:hypothetical protein n=1 Tax=Bacteria TaxID=2 RepID=UPI0012B165C0|nr:MULTISPECIES: hypothetical protein [Bacteria]MRY42734.1 hypothetical protein [Parabacteroides distasonis]MZK53334.1 hypothetical protein [Clostridium beijerinckii]MZK61439.1 hypothetical protein [Clostridium beijerinckii]MZK71681.1 hypothetical protein [Clostridium beijerinckii]MZK77074.1 hypothetical protein [Clostridium beijerinckii]